MQDDDLTRFRGIPRIAEVEDFYLREKAEACKHIGLSCESCHKDYCENSPDHKKWQNEARRIN
jgi:signal recognition particle subunit SEC65